MATTVTPTTLTTTITESITLNGVTYDKTTTNSIASVATYNSRVYQLKASTTHTLIEFTSDPTSGKFDTEDFKYMRITNLDDTNAINITFAEESTVGCGFQLDAGESFVISALQVDSNTSGSALTTLGHSITDVFIVTGASETDVEVVIATA
jgi:hypothetical protein